MLGHCHCFIASTSPVRRIVVVKEMFLSKLETNACCARVMNQHNDHRSILARSRCFIAERPVSHSYHKPMALC